MILHKKHIINTLHYIGEGSVDLAKAYFNEHLRGINEDLLSSNDGNMSDVALFLGELDDYVHDPVTQISGAIQLEDLKKTFLEIEKNL